MPTYQQDIEVLRDWFDSDEGFPKDQEAIDGIRPSLSHRSEALVLWSMWHMIAKKAYEEGVDFAMKSIKGYQEVEDSVKKQAYEAGRASVINDTV